MTDQFWTDVATAYKTVAFDNSQEITVARGGIAAKIKSVDFGEKELPAVVILITQKETQSKEAFIVP